MPKNFIKKKIAKSVGKTPPTNERASNNLKYLLFTSLVNDDLSIHKSVVVWEEKVIDVLFLNGFVLKLDCFSDWLKGRTLLSVVIKSWSS